MHRWIVWLMLTVLVASVGTWWATRESLPGEIRIATAAEGGLYHRFATLLGERLTERTGRRVRLVPTLGSVQNCKLLESHEVDLAILQSTSVPLEDGAVIAPLYPEVVCVIVRADRGIVELPDLAGRSVLLGPEGSGMRESAQRLLAHYRIGLDEVSASNGYFLELSEDATLEATLVTTGLTNPDLHALLAGDKFQLVPIQDAEAIALRQPLFRPFVLPRGLFHERPPVPPGPVETVAATALLVTDSGAPDVLVQAALEALYESNLHLEFAPLIQARDAVVESPVKLHPVAERYHDPYGGLDRLASFIESLSGIKELVFGFFALVYLAWDALRRWRERDRQREVRVQKDRLDSFLARTVRIERAQMDTRDLERLENYLDDVTRIKLDALEELTHEDLRGDQTFAIFMAQCANLIRKIQTKILTARVLGSPVGSGARGLGPGAHERE